MQTQCKLNAIQIQYKCNTKANECQIESRVQNQ